MNPNLTVTLSGLIGGGGALVRASDTLQNNTGTLVISNSANSFSGGFTLQSQAGNVDVQGASTYLYNGVTLVSGPLGIGSITIGNSNNNAGTSYLGNSSATPSTLFNTMNLYDNVGFGSLSGLTLSGVINLTGPDNAGVAQVWLLPNANVNIAGNVSSGTQGINLRTGGGSGGLTLSGTNYYTGKTSITMGTLIAGGNVSNGAAGPFGNATTAITVGDGNSGGNPAALLTSGPYTIGRPITFNNNADLATLGTLITSGTATYSGAITLNNSTYPVSLSSPAGGTVLISTNIGGTGTSGVVVAAPSTIVFSGSDSYSGPTSVTGGLLQNSGTLAINNAASAVSGGMLLDSGLISTAGSGAITVSGGTLSLAANSVFSGTGTISVGALGTLSGAGSISSPTAVSGRLSPSLGSPLKISNSLALNSGATFLMTSGGGTVGLVQGVSALTASAAVNLQVLPQDAGTLNGSTSYTFLAWNGSGPASGTPANWTVSGANLISWTGASDQSTWGTTGNWGGWNVSGGTVQSVNNGTSGYLEVNGLNEAASGPIAGSNVLIQSSTGATVAGPSAATSVRSLTLGSGSGGVNTLNLGAGLLAVTGTATGAAGTTVNATGLLNIGSGSLSTTSLSIAGSATVGPGGTLTASGAVNVNSLGVLSIGTSGFAAPAMTINIGGTLVGTVANALNFTGTNSVTLYGQAQVANSGPNIISGNIVGAGGEFNFTSPQTSSPTLTVAAGMGLFGNLTNFTYGSTGSVTLAANSTLSPVAGGTLPTRAQLGGAILLAPLLAADTGSYSVGDDGSTSIYKGVSLGSWTTVGGVAIGNGGAIPCKQRRFQLCRPAGREFLGHDFRHRQQRFHGLPERAERDARRAHRVQRGCYVQYLQRQPGRRVRRTGQRDFPQPLRRARQPRRHGGGLHPCGRFRRLEHLRRHAAQHDGQPDPHHASQCGEQPGRQDARRAGPHAQRQRHQYLADRQQRHRQFRRLFGAVRRRRRPGAGHVQLRAHRNPPLRRQFAVDKRRRQL